MKKGLFSILAAAGIAMGSLFATTGTVSAEDVWAATASNGDMAYVVSESVYNQGNGFGCNVKIFTNRSHSWSTEAFYFGQDDNGIWFCYRNNKLERTWGVEHNIFDVASRYR